MFNRIYNFLHFCLRIYGCLKNNFPFSLAVCCSVSTRKIPKSTRFPHPYGIIIRNDTKIGENCIILHNVTIGSKVWGGPETKNANIGNNVFIGANATILGPVNISDNVQIGAGSIVLNDVPPDHTVVGIWK